MSARRWSEAVAATLGVALLGFMATAFLEQQVLTRKVVLAMVRGDDKGFATLARCGGDVAARDVLGRQPLMYAALAGDMDTARALLHRGADVNAKAIGGFPVLFYSRGERMTHLLFEAGADVNIRDGRGATPLMYASGDGDVGRVRLLLSHGGRVNDADDEGRTPLLRAVMMDHRSVAVILLKSGATPSKMDVYGETPLIFAARNGSVEMIQMLVRRGVPLSGRDGQGATAYDNALSYGHQKAAALLKKLGRRARADRGEAADPYWVWR